MSREPPSHTFQTLCFFHSGRRIPSHTSTKPIAYAREAFRGSSHGANVDW